MSFLSLRSNPLRLTAVAASGLAGAVLFASSFATAQTGPFANLEGAWAGDGTISTNSGRSERIRCRAKYFVSPSGQDLDQQLRCASDSYRFDVNSGLVRQANGEIAGTWTETTRNATGQVSARDEGDVIVAKVTGASFTADMTVTTQGDGQTVQITPNGGGSDIKSVSVDLRRE
jgi:hypothetical protein